MLFAKRVFVASPEASGDRWNVGSRNHSVDIMLSMTLKRLYQIPFNLHLGQPKHITPSLSFLFPVTKWIILTDVKKQLFLEQRRFSQWLYQFHQISLYHWIVFTNVTSRINFSGSPCSKWIKATFFECFFKGLYNFFMFHFPSRCNYVFR